MPFSKIGVLGAMQEEVECFVSLLENPKTQEVGCRTYHTGRLHGREVVCAFSRWGKVASASTATTLIDRFGAELIFFIGVAGGIDPKLNVGDIVVASELVQHDLDVSALPMFEKFEIPFLGKTRLAIRPDLLKTAEEQTRAFVAGKLTQAVDANVLKEFGIVQPNVVSGLIASGDRFVANPAEVEQLRRELPGLQCVEMEGGAVAQVCEEHGVPYIVTRIISDKADHSAPVDFPKFIAQAASPMGGHLAKHVLSKI